MNYRALDIDLVLGSQIRGVKKIDLRTKFSRTRAPLLKENLEVSGGGR